jgi:single-strand DNA-binding protein
MNDTYMTIIGNVVAPPRLRVTKSGHSVANFRVASTSRRFDTEQGRYVDNATLFVNVTCWRAMAENVDLSLKKGQPVIVTGRYYSREYELNETVRVSYELEASAVGHDLSRGTADFRKVFRPAGTVQMPVDDEGIPVDDSDHWLDIATGEVLHPDSADGTPDPAATSGTGPLVVHADAASLASVG